MIQEQHILSFQYHSGKRLTADERSLLFPMEFAEDGLMMEQCESNEEQDREADIKGTNRMTVLKQLEVMAHRFTVSCSQRLFAQSHEN
jgi:hypothetical protein